MIKLSIYGACGLLVLVAALCSSSCGAQAADIQALGVVQERSSQQISLALARLAENQISPQDAKLVVDNAIKVNQVAVAATITKLQEDVLSWWQVALTAIGSAIPVVGAGMALLNQRRNSTSEDRVTMSIEKILAARGLTSDKA